LAIGLGGLIVGCMSLSFLSLSLSLSLSFSISNFLSGSLSLSLSPLTHIQHRGGPYLSASCVRRHRADLASSRPHTHESATARALMAANAASECSLMALRLRETGVYARCAQMAQSSKIQVC
jgi:hypothetical protein